MTRRRLDWTAKSAVEEELVDDEELPNSFWLLWVTDPGNQIWKYRYIHDPGIRWQPAWNAIGRDLVHPNVKYRECAFTALYVAFRPLRWLSRERPKRGSGERHDALNYLYDRLVTRGAYRPYEDEYGQIVWDPRPYIGTALSNWHRDAEEVQPKTISYHQQEHLQRTLAHLRYSIDESVLEDPGLNELRNDLALFNILRPEDFDLLLLFEVAEMSWDEIAARLNVSVAAVRQRARRARKHLWQPCASILTTLLLEQSRSETRPVALAPPLKSRLPADPRTTSWFVHVRETVDVRPQRWRVKVVVENNQYYKKQAKQPHKKERLSGTPPSTLGENTEALVVYPLTTWKDHLFLVVVHNEVHQSLTEQGKDGSAKHKQNIFSTDAIVKDSFKEPYYMWPAKEGLAYSQAFPYLANAIARYQTAYKTYLLSTVAPSLVLSIFPPNNPSPDEQSDVA